MPQISEIASSMIPGTDSPQTSLQVSSTSPEVVEAPSKGKALSVKKTGKIASRSSSSSSRASLPPTGIQRGVSSGGASHRGHGSLPQHVSMNRMDVQVDVETVDQSSEHVEHNYHDHRTQQQLNVLSVGVDPAVAHARESQLRNEALNVVAQYHQQSQEAQRVAEVSVMGAEQRVAQFHSEASAHVAQLNAQHREEISRVQHAANLAHGKLNLQLQRSEQYNQDLFEKLESQQCELAEQRDRFQEMQAMVLSLQNQLTVVHHQSNPPMVSQNGTDHSELMNCISALRSEVRQLKEDNQRRSMMQSSSPTAMPHQYNIATPVIPVSQGQFPAGSPFVTPHASVHAVSPMVSPTQSACAGYVPQGFMNMSSRPQPPGQPGSPSSSSSSGTGDLGKGKGGKTPLSTHVPSWPSDPDGGGEGGSPMDRSQGGLRSVGAGSAMINDESSIYRTKDLQSVIVPTLPNDAAQFRGWRNSFLTKASSIDKTGENRIMTWLLGSFSADTTVEYLEQTSLEMPRLDAYLASQLMEPKHLRGELGLQFQAYAEREQLRGRAPLGRVLLNMVARRFFLDLSRGANLTQQSLLELDISSYTYEGLRTFVDRIEFVLNSIPPDLQPSELTRYTWLYSRLKKVRLMQRHIDRIKDSKQTSHVRCWDWLFNKLKTTLLEMKEDQNEESIRTALQTQAKAKPKAKGNVAQTGEGENATASAAAAKAKPKAKPKPKPANNPKGSSKGRDDGPGASTKSDSKGKGTSKGDAKAKAKPKPDSQSVPCIFWPKGTCNRGSDCPFFHDPKAAPKASAAAAKGAPTNPKGGAPGGSAGSNAASKATVATVAALSLSKASAAEVRPDGHCSTSMFSRFKHLVSACARPFQSFFKCFAALTCLTSPLQQIHDGTLAFASSGASQGLQQLHDGTLAFASSGASQGMPAVLSYQRAMIAQHDQRGVYEISWIADSGAGRDLASMKDFQDQGIPKQSLNQFLQSTQNVRFETGNGCVNSDTSVIANGSKFGDASFHVTQSCPLVRSLGQIVESGKPFVWLPGQLPFFGLDVDAIQIAADSERLFVADKVDDHVPIFSETMQFEAPYSFGLPSAEVEHVGESPVAEPAPPEVPVLMILVVMQIRRMGIKIQKIGMPSL